MTRLVGREYMNNGQENTSDSYVIRPQVLRNEIMFQGQSLAPGQRKRTQKALRALHSLEIMAVNIYRFQLNRQQTLLNQELIAAMCNEATHTQDFLVKLYEYGMRPSKFRWFWWLVGMAFGLISRFLGPKAMLKTGVWTENKAVAHYTELLTLDWDPATRAVIEKDLADEQKHINTWKHLLETGWKKNDKIE